MISTLAPVTLLMIPSVISVLRPDLMTRIPVTGRIGAVGVPMPVMSFETARPVSILNAAQSSAASASAGSVWPTRNVGAECVGYFG